MANNEFNISSQGGETPECGNGTGGAPFHLISRGEWGGKIRVFVKLHDCTTWIETTHWYTKNFDERLQYPSYTKLKLVAEEFDSGEITITVCH